MLSELEYISNGTSNFSGPLPSELGNLMKLKTLRAFDIELTGRIPDFIGNWPHLKELRFQGNSFEGPILSSFSKSTNLTDLRISDISNGSSSSLAFIRNLKSVKTLFLGNNTLNGTLPEEKSKSSQYLTFSSLDVGIDVSYNNLSDNLPSWIQEQNLQLYHLHNDGTNIQNVIGAMCNSLVANNFNLESSNYSKITSIFLPPLPSVLCHMARTVSNAIFHAIEVLQFRLHWYADLSFAIKCAGPTITSQDIVYEGDNEPLGSATYYLTTIDRWGVVGGVLRRAIQREYPAQVSENYMEIHFFWAGKGTYCIPDDGTYGPSISAISATKDFKPPSQKKRTCLIVGIVVVVGAAWHLYKNNHQLELGDSKLSEFSKEEVKGLIGVAFLCTQTLPSSRPSMSRVIATLCGDMEVSAVNSKLGYLTEWAFDDVTTFLSDDINEECEDTSHYISPTWLRTMDKTLEISATEALFH
ncbi:hypothetical protein Pint_18590 [Pistacia integerrima]|uniref:Uncharacterized protein n=1 Tax=Pistacia integerrima TaxID=434235 RepID=A0ACC0YTS3_9ROSI|nr:hypothetical protein Pint_18590 [Pistacia integerrima]